MYSINKSLNLNKNTINTFSILMEIYIKFLLGQRQVKRLPGY